MFQVTGLGMGETRSAEEIRTYEEGHYQDSLYGETKKGSLPVLEEDRDRKELEPTRFKK